MPTPIVLPNNRLAFVAECPKCYKSPWLVASDPNDWDFENFLNQPWSSINYTGVNDDNVYPNDPDNLWQPTSAWGNAPYATVLSTGQVAISQNSHKRIRVWVGNANAKNTVEQKRPFGNIPSFYSFIEPINDAFVLVGAHQNFTHDILLRRGFIVKIDYLDELLNLGLRKKAIKSHEVYKILLAKVKHIQDMKKVRNILDGLNAVSHEVAGQSGKTIKWEFAGYLDKIIGYLMEEYQIE